MTGLVRKATLLAVAGVLTASAALAAVPSAANSTGPVVVGLCTRNNVGTPDALDFGTGHPTTWTVNVRDLANNPIANASVVFDLSQASDLLFCAAQVHADGTPDADVLINCAAKTARKFTDALGNVTFTMVGQGKGNVPASGFNNGRIFANGVLIKSPTVATCNLNGNLGIDPADQGQLLTDINVGGRGRSDINGDGVLNAVDKGFWLTHFNAPTSVQGCASLGTCP